MLGVGGGVKGFGSREGDGNGSGIGFGRGAGSGMGNGCGCGMGNGSGCIGDSPCTDFKKISASIGPSCAAQIHTKRAG